MNKAEAIYKIVVEGIYPEIQHKFPNHEPQPYSESLGLALFSGVDCALQSFPKIPDAIANRDKAALMEHFKAIRDPQTEWSHPPSSIVKHLISQAPLFSPDLFEVDIEAEKYIWKCLAQIIKTLQ